MLPWESPIPTPAIPDIPIGTLSTLPLPNPARNSQTMIKIRPVGPAEYPQVLQLFRSVAMEERLSHGRVDHLSPLYTMTHGFSQWLPSHWQFLPGVFVAVFQGKVLGLVWVEAEERRLFRWSIRELLVAPDENLSDIGSRMVQYVVNRFGGDGVQTFTARVLNQNDSMLGIFKSCGFRHGARQTLYRWTPSAEEQTSCPAPHIAGLRPAHGSDRHMLAQLYRDALAVEARHALERHPSHVLPGVWKTLGARLQGQFHKTWVVEERGHVELLAALTVQTSDYSNFQAEMMLSPAWQYGAFDMLNVLKVQLFKMTHRPAIELSVLEFQKDILAAVKEHEFQAEETVEILVKDYWQPIARQSPKDGSPILLFGRGKTSPASPI